MGQCASLSNISVQTRRQPSPEDGIDEPQDVDFAASIPSATARRTKKPYRTGIRTGAASLKLQDKLLLAQALIGGREEGRSVRPGPERSNRPSRQVQPSSPATVDTISSSNLDGGSNTNATAAGSSPSQRPYSRASSPAFKDRTERDRSRGRSYSRAISNPSGLQGDADSSLRKMHSLGGGGGGAGAGGTESGAVRSAGYNGCSNAVADDALAIIGMAKMLRWTPSGPLPGSPGHRPQPLLQPVQQRLAAVHPNPPAAGAVRQAPVRHLSGALSRAGAAAEGGEDLGSTGLPKLRESLILNTGNLLAIEEGAATSNGAGSSRHGKLPQPQQQNFVCSQLMRNEGRALTPPSLFAWEGPGGGGAPLQEAPRPVSIRSRVTQEPSSVPRFHSEPIDSKRGHGAADVVMEISVCRRDDGDGGDCGCEAIAGAARATAAAAVLAATPASPASKFVTDRSSHNRLPANPDAQPKCFAATTTTQRSALKASPADGQTPSRPHRPASSPDSLAATGCTVFPDPAAAPRGAAPAKAAALELAN